MVGFGYASKAQRRLTSVCAREAPRPLERVGGAMTTRYPTVSEPDRERAVAIQTMFGRLVPWYDRMNRCMTIGLDGRWRHAAAAAAEPESALVLDLGSGTGDLARALERAGAARVIRVDFTRLMLVADRRKAEARGEVLPSVLQADALQIPFPDASFDAVTSGFLLRNLVDLPQGLQEMLRVLRPGGRLVALDITHVPAGPLALPRRFVFHRLATGVAARLSGDHDAYRYLSRSLDGYPDVKALAQMLMDAGAVNVRVRRMGAGTIALHSARRPLPDVE